VAGDLREGDPGRQRHERERQQQPSGDQAHRRVGLRGRGARQRAEAEDEQSQVGAEQTDRGSDVHR
jgi:hypothetical protein